MLRPEMVLAKSPKQMTSSKVLVLFSSILVVLSTVLPVCQACLCHLVPNYTCAPPPHCCESGQYTYDECGCCLTCAKSELQPCGGPSNSVGKCAQGLACLKTCTACKTIGTNPEPCLFPFEYQGHTFDKCTVVDAVESGTAWCATEVYGNKTVIDGRWGNCDEGCPGARHACDDRRFSILIGKCINPNVPGAIPNWIGAPPYRLLDKTKDLFAAPLCSTDNSKRRRLYSNTCRCAEGEDTYELEADGTIRGNCTGVDNDDGDSVNPVWCFLENIRDPSNPSSGCYADTTWSPKDGRFWSAEACNGLPPLDTDNILIAGPNQPLGEKNPLFQAALQTPFKKPEDVFEVKSRFQATTKSPRKQFNPRNGSSSTTTANSREEIDAPTRRPTRRRTTTASTTTASSTTTTTAAATKTSTEQEKASIAETTISLKNSEESSVTSSTTTTSSKSSATDIPIDEADFEAESEADDSFNFEDYKAFFEADDNDDFTITSPRNEKSENTTTGSAASGETTPRVGRNPLLNQPTAQYYDESEDYEDKTDFRDLDDLYYFETDDVKDAKNAGQYYEDEDDGNADTTTDSGVTLLMNLPIVNQREDGLEFLPTPVPSTQKRRQKIDQNLAKHDDNINKDNDEEEGDLQDFDGSDPPPLTTRRTTEASGLNVEETTLSDDKTTFEISTLLPGSDRSDSAPDVTTVESLSTAEKKEAVDATTLPVDSITAAVDSTTNAADDSTTAADTKATLIDVTTTTFDATTTPVSGTTTSEVSKTTSDVELTTLVGQKTRSNDVTTRATPEETSETHPNFDSTTTANAKTTNSPGPTTTATATVNSKESETTSESKGFETTTFSDSTSSIVAFGNDTTVRNVVNVTTEMPLMSDVTQAHRSPKSQNIESQKVDLGIFGSFWLQKPVQVGEVSDTERPSPIFRLEDYTDRYPA